MSFKKILSVLLFVWPLNSFAGGYSRLAFMYLSDNIGTQGASTEVSRTLIDFGAGHLFNNGITLGGMYGSEKNETATQSLNRTGIGPTIGYMNSKSKGFFFLGTYFFNPTMTGGYKGTGTQIDIGYRFQLDKISIAPQFSKKTFKYTKLNDITIDPPYVDDRVDPYFVVWIDF